MPFIIHVSKLGEVLVRCGGRAHPKEAQFCSFFFHFFCMVCAKSSESLRCNMQLVPSVLQRVSCLQQARWFKLSFPVCCVIIPEHHEVGGESIFPTDANQAWMRISRLLSSDLNLASEISQEGESSNNRKWSALGCAAVCGAATVRRAKRAQKRQVSRQVYKVEIDVPDPKEVEKEIETIAGPAISKDLQQIGRVASEMLHSAEKALPKVTLPSLPTLPAVPPELTAAARQLAAKVEAALGPNLTDLSKLAATHLPPDIAKVLLHPQVLEPAMMPAGELPREYDYGRITAYWQRRPLKLLTRFVEAGIKVGGFLFGLKTDERTGAEDKMRPQRAIEARELITDLGVTFIKIAQVWASRPDILPKEYLKEYEKLLEQVRPFGRDLALETLRRRVDGSKAAIDLSPGRNEEA
eukprot:s4727_g2.t1